MFERRTLSRVLALTFAVTVLCGATPAVEAEEAPTGDIAAGKEVAKRCVTCHGFDGIGAAPEIPHLAGQHADYMLKALQEYKEGERAGDFMTAMIVSVDSLDDADMANVVAYYASLPVFTRLTAKPADKNAAPEEDPFAAVKAMTEACAGCHGADGNVELPGMPSLAGQHAEYLVDALKAYKDGRRKHDMMQAFVEPLGQAEIDEISFYYAAMKPKRAMPAEAGDPFAGRAPAAACAVCHGEDGNTDDPKTPRLAGLDAEYLAAAIKAYQDGSREHSVMQEIVAPLDKTEIVDMSAFYATKEPRALPIRKPLTTKEWVEKCDRCHGPGGNSTDPRFPVIAGQSEAYLLKTLKHYHRKTREDPMMYAMSFAMNEADINKLAAYYASSGANQ